LPSLGGGHQLGNAASALAALAVSGFCVPLSQVSVARALREASIPGRFQRIPGEVEWILDVAHNVPAAETLRDNLRRLPRARRTLAVCGILGDKDIRGIMSTLGAEVDAWILAALEGPRAVSTQQLAQQLPAGTSVLAHAGNMVEACRLARSTARAGDRVLVFGSFLAVGPALEFLGL
jgi:dihydrofolate synthase/folylpolyglutamate synthase